MPKGRKVVHTEALVRGELLDRAYQKALDFVFGSGDAADDPRVYENVGSHIIAIARGGETRSIEHESRLATVRAAASMIAGYASNRTGTSLPTKG